MVRRRGSQTGSADVDSPPTALASHATVIQQQQRQQHQQGAAATAGPSVWVHGCAYAVSPTSIAARAARGRERRLPPRPHRTHAGQGGCNMARYGSAWERGRRERASCGPRVRARARGAAASHARTHAPNPTLPVASEGAQPARALRRAARRKSGAGAVNGDAGSRHRRCRVERPAGGWNDWNELLFSAAESIWPTVQGRHTIALTGSATYPRCSSSSASLAISSSESSFS